MKSKKQNKQTNREIYRYREQNDDCQVGEVLGRLGEKGERIEKHKLAVIKSPCCTPETNIILHVNCIWGEKKEEETNGLI